MDKKKEAQAAQLHRKLKSKVPPGCLSQSGGVSVSSWLEGCRNVMD